MQTKLGFSIALVLLSLGFLVHYQANEALAETCVVESNSTQGECKPEFDSVCGKQHGLSKSRSQISTRIFIPVSSDDQGDYYNELACLLEAAAEKWDSNCALTPPGSAKRFEVVRGIRPEGAPQDIQVELVSDSSIQSHAQ